MALRIPATEQSNFETFRDCVSEPVLKALAAPSEKAKPKEKKNKKKKKRNAQNGLRDG